MKRLGFSSGFYLDFDQIAFSISSFLFVLLIIVKICFYVNNRNKLKGNIVVDVIFWIE
jgi:hypothetical protein